MEEGGRRVPLLVPCCPISPHSLPCLARRLCRHLPSCPCRPPLRALSSKVPFCHVLSHPPRPAISCPVTFRPAPPALSPFNPIPQLLARASLPTMRNAPTCPPPPAMTRPAPIIARPSTPLSNMPLPTPSVACPARPARLLFVLPHVSRDAPRHVQFRPDRLVPPHRPPRLSATRRRLLL